jgi:His-Xaa-Ser system protein HxsD
MPATKAPATRSITTRTAAGQGFLSVHKTLYPNEVLFGTAFAFLDRCYVHLDVEDADRVRVELTPRAGSPLTAGELAGEFKNELVNQALRFKLAKQTEKVRTMIVGRAIAEAVPAEDAPRDFPGSQVPDLPPEVAKLLAEEDDGLDFLDDPLGIAVPWEEKYGKKKDGEDKPGKAPGGK